MKIVVAKLTSTDTPPRMLIYGPRENLTKVKSHQKRTNSSADEEDINGRMSTLHQYQNLISTFSQI